MNNFVFAHRTILKRRLCMKQMEISFTRITRNSSKFCDLLCKLLILDQSKRKKLEVNKASTDHTYGKRGTTLWNGRGCNKKMN